MKRDARIGLAVVLVLGLTITLLVARALHQHAQKIAETSGEARPTETAREDGAGGTENATTETDESSIAAAQQTQDQAIGQFQTEHGAATPVRAAAVAPSAGAATRADVVDVPTYQAQTGVPPRPTPVAAHSVALPPVGQAPAAVSASVGAPARTSAAPAATPANALGFYSITPGDNPWKISAKIFGDGRYAQKIVDANPGLNPSRLSIGQKLRIPALPGMTSRISLSDAASAPAPAPVAPISDAGGSGPILAETHAPAPSGEQGRTATSAASGEVKTYTIQPGDTLGKIAKETLGSAGPKALKRLMDANPGVDAMHLKVGASLKLPAAQP